MANVFTNPLNEHLQSTRRKPDTDYQERLKQAQRIKAVANIMSLVGQGVFAPKGADILPMDDKVTPFAMNEFGRMREDEIKQGDMERQMGVSAMMKDIDYTLSQQDKDKQAKLRAEEAEKQRKFQAGENEKYRRTPYTYEEELELRKAQGGITTDNQVKLAQEQSKLRREENEQKNRQAIQQIVARNSSTSKTQDYPLTIKDTADKQTYNFTAKEISNAFSIMMNDPEISKDLEDNHPVAYWDFVNKAKSPDEEFIATKIRQHWPKVKQELHKMVGGATQQGQPSQVDDTKLRQAQARLDDIIGPDSKIPKAKQRDAFFEVFTWAGLSYEQIEQLWAKANQ